MPERRAEELLYKKEEWKLNLCLMLDWIIDQSHHYHYYYYNFTVLLLGQLVKSEQHL